MDEAPVRLCCGQRHWAVACPDGRVMCCLCFDRFEQEELYSDDEGTWDICAACHDHEQKVREEIAQGRCVCLPYSRTGICHHVIPFLKKEDVEAKEEYL